MVLGGAVRGGTKALQKMTAQERLQSLHAATQDLEATARGSDTCPVSNKPMPMPLLLHV